MGNVEQAKRVYREAVELTNKARWYVGANSSRLHRELTAEASAAAVYIYALEEADAIRKNEEQYKHRKPGEAL